MPSARLFTLCGIAAALLAVPVAIAASPCAPSLPSAPLTLVAALDTALCRAPQTQATWAQAKVQAALLDTAKADRFPTVSANLTNNNNDTDSNHTRLQTASVQLAYTLFDFGQREARIDQAHALLNAAQANTDTTLANVWLATSKAYFDAGRATAQIAAFKVAEQSAQASLAAAERRLAVGTASPLEVLQARAALSQARLDRTKAESLLTSANGNLALAMSLPPQQLPALAALPRVSPQLPAEAQQLPLLLQQAVNHRPEVRAALTSLNAAEANVQLANAQNRPVLAMTAGLGANRFTPPQNNYHSGNVTLTLKLPLDFNGSIAAGQRGAEALREARQADLTRIQQGVENEAWQAYQSIRTSLATTAAADDLAHAARQAHEAALARYQVGLSSTLDVLTAQTSRATAEQQRISAQFDWLLARATLAYALGGSLPADPLQPSPWVAPLLPSPMTAPDTESRR